jgi:hypothetical protein
MSGGCAYSAVGVAVLRLRYGEPRVFLEVSSVMSQYSLEGDVSIGGGPAPVNSGLVRVDSCQTVLKM